MVMERSEVEEFASVASAVLVNIGTASENCVPLFLSAADACRKHDVPWVLDPVGVGCSHFRRTLCGELLARAPAVIRGNMGEISALCDSSIKQTGVDAGEFDEITSKQRALTLALKTQCVVVASGETDYVTNGQTVLSCGNGVAMLQNITATGCSLTALIAAFHGTAEAFMPKSGKAMKFFLDLR